MTVFSSRVVSAGDTFLLRKPGRNSIPHLWVVVTDPDDDGKVVIASLTTRRPHSDDTVILRREDHPFIRHETVIFYQDARMPMASDLMKAVHGGAATLHAPFRLEVLTDIQGGIGRSPHTPNHIKEYVRRQLA